MWSFNWFSEWKASCLHLITLEKDYPLLTVNHLLLHLFSKPSYAVWTKVSARVRDALHYLTDQVQPGLFYKHNFYSVSQRSFSLKSSKCLHPKTVRGTELNFWVNIHLPPCVRVHVSCIIIHVSCVICHMWNKKSLYIYPFISFVLQSSGACPWRVCYQRGILCLV